MNLKEMRSKSTKNLRMISVKQIDSDVENDIEDEIMELMKLYSSGSNINKKVLK